MRAFLLLCGIFCVAAVANAVDAPLLELTAEQDHKLMLAVRHRLDLPGRQRPRPERAERAERGDAHREGFARGRA